MAKESLIDVYDRKVDYLRERKDEQERQIDKLRSDLREKSKAYEEVLFEYRNL